MKKRLILLFAATLFAVGTLSAQGKNEYDAQEKGWWLGGQVGYWYNSDYHSFAIAPEFGHDFNRHIRFLTHIGFLGLRSDSYNNGLGDGVGFSLSASDLKFGFYYTF